MHGLSNVEGVEFLPHDNTVARVRLRSQQAAAASLDSLEGRFFQGGQLAVRQLSQVRSAPPPPPTLLARRANANQPI
jgi:hypothetical protein